MPLNHLRADQAPFEVIDSPLSEAAVLGFDYGYSLDRPARCSALWEAQFGDFANGAQVIIDQFIASGESKWQRPAASSCCCRTATRARAPSTRPPASSASCRLCAEDNIQVVNATTPAQYFHLLRRQVRRNFRKPLVVMTPKSLLRSPEVAARLEEMGPGTCFHRLIEESDPLVADAQVRRVRAVQRQGLLRSAHAAARAQDRRRRDPPPRAALSLPGALLAETLRRYRNAEIVWCQEEPENMGAWSFIDRRIETVLASLDVNAKRARYVGRPEAAATATGPA